VEQGTTNSAAGAAAVARRTSLRAERREIAAVALVAIAVVLGILPSWLMSWSFFPVEGNSMAGGNDWVMRVDWATHSLWWYVTHRLHWGLSVGALHLVPLWYWLWRRSRMAWGGLVGIALSLGTAAALWLTIAETRADLARKIAQFRADGYHPALVATAFVFAAAFVVAPPPRDPEALNELQVKSLLRKQK
jgi:hypothetical protein